MLPKNSIFADYNRPLVFGHRGVPEHHQENTMPGFKLASKLGLDGVELDVFLTKDKKLIVFHDKSPERLTGVKGDVSKMTWDELKELEIEQSINVGDKTIHYGKKEKIALLEDVLEEVKGKLIVDIEIKAHKLDFSQRKTGTEVAKLIRKMDLFNQVFVTSFNVFPLIGLEKECPSIESGFTYSPAQIKKGGLLHNIMESSLVGELAGSTLTNMSIDMFDDDSIEKIHAKNMAIGVWTLFCQDSKCLGAWLTEEEQIEYIKHFTARKIDYFITDDPEKLTRVLQTI